MWVHHRPTDTLLLDTSWPSSFLEERAAFVAVVEKATLLADASGFALNDLSRDDE